MLIGYVSRREFGFLPEIAIKELLGGWAKFSLEFWLAGILQTLVTAVVENLDFE